jgi:thioredoxin reductase
VALLSRRDFIRLNVLASAAFVLPGGFPTYLTNRHMNNNQQFDVIIIGGSYSGLAAGMALGRALRNVLIIDSGKPCNRQTPHSHNFLTQDGKTPREISSLARQQVEKYETVQFFSGRAIHGMQTERGFEIGVASGETFSATKLVFATGIRDMLPDIDGYAACWGISLLHCPYCHGYEVRNVATAVLGNGTSGVEFAALISNWTPNLTLFTNGPADLASEQHSRLEHHGIPVVETRIRQLEHTNGQLQKIVFEDNTTSTVTALYGQHPFEQHCRIPEALGCALTDEGYIRVDPLQRTTVPGIFACGDATTRMRTVAGAVAGGTTAGMMTNKEWVLERF